MKEKHLFTQKQKKWIAFTGVLLFLLLSGVIGWYVGRPMVRFAKNPDLFRDWVDNYGAWSGIVYAGMVLLQVLVAVIPGEPLEICGGYAFGAVKGSILCLAGAFAGSILVFALVRRWGREVVEIFFPSKKLENLRFLQSSPRRDFLFFIIFSLPGTPKDLLCYFSGLTDMSWRNWLVICSVGRLPSILTSTIGGNALGVQNYSHAVVIFAITMGISLLGVAIYHVMVRRHDKKKNQEKQDSQSNPL